MTTGRFSPHSVRFVVALYEGANGAQTRDWIEANFQEELASGTLVVGWLNDLSSFQRSRCKYVSHVLSLMVAKCPRMVLRPGLSISIVPQEGGKTSPTLLPRCRTTADTF